MKPGDRVEIYDGDRDEWVLCDVESIGPMPGSASFAEMVVLQPVDDLVDAISGLRQIYGVPWPAGAEVIRYPS